MLVFTEPEGQDFWLKPGQTVELRAEIEFDEAVFIQEETKEGVTIWPSVGMGYIETYLKDILLECGFQRPHGWP